MYMYLTTARKPKISRSQVNSQGHSTGFSDSLPLRDSRTAALSSIKFCRNMYPYENDAGMGVFPADYGVWLKSLAINGSMRGVKNASRNCLTDRMHSTL